MFYMSFKRLIHQRNEPYCLTFDYDKATPASAVEHDRERRLQQQNHTAELMSVFGDTVVVGISTLP